MPKIVSDKQRAANRKNAKKSTGPRTPKGKTRSRRNALKHGLLARDVVVTTPNSPERREDFDAFIADLISELKPRGVIEETLVERIATCYWRLHRAQRFESQAIRDQATAQTSIPAFVQSEKLQTAEQQLQVELRLDQLLRIPDQASSPQQTQELHHSLHDFSDAHSLTRLNLDDSALQQKIREMLPTLIDRLQHRVEAIRAELNANQPLEATGATRSDTPYLLPPCALLQLLRYETMLDRQIHRALAELRRLQRVPRRDTKKKAILRNEPI